MMGKDKKEDKLKCGEEPQSSSWQCAEAHTKPLSAKPAHTSARCLSSSLWHFSWSASDRKITRCHGAPSIFVFRLLSENSTLGAFGSHTSVINQLRPGVCVRARAHKCMYVRAGLHVSLSGRRSITVWVSCTGGTMRVALCLPSVNSRLIHLWAMRWQLPRPGKETVLYLAVADHYALFYKWIREHKEIISKEDEK